MDTPEQVWEHLKEGNTLFTSGHFGGYLLSLAQGVGEAQRNANKKGQQPHTVVVACSDSRVSPEVIFNQGIGHVFVVRFAFFLFRSLFFPLSFSIFSLPFSFRSLYSRLLFFSLFRSLFSLFSFFFLNLVLSYRAAGNVVDPVALDSIDYAIEHLHAKLIVVVGHQHCGAVKAGTLLTPQPHNETDKRK